MSDWQQPVKVSTLVLTIFALATGALIAGTYLGTKDTIIEQERLAQAKALLEIMPKNTHDNSLVDDTIEVLDEELLNLTSTQNIYVARQAGKVSGFIIPSIAPDGYSGAMQIVTGINRDGSIVGVRVLAHNETPGLGDKVDIKKSSWVLNFEGKSLTMPAPNRWKVKKDKGEFDQFTGATITPRAVVKAVYNTLQYYQNNKVDLLSQAQTNEPVTQTTKTLSSVPIGDNNNG